MKPSDKKRKIQGYAAEKEVDEIPSSKRLATAGNEFQQRMSLTSQENVALTECHASYDTMDEPANIVGLPDHWTSMRDDEWLKVVTLNKNDDEYKMVAQRFYYNMNSSTDQILQVSFEDYCCT